MVNFLKYFLFFLFLNALALKSSAQQPAYFILGKDEFEGVQIYDVIQDNQSNYWFATDRGFYKYDGYEFASIDHKGMKGQAAFGFVKNKNGIIFAYNLNYQILKIENNKCSVFYELSDSEKSADVHLMVTPQNHLLVLTHTALLFNETGQKLPIPSMPVSYYGFPFQLKNGAILSHLLESDSLLVVQNGIPSLKPIKSDLKISGLLKFFVMNNKTFAISLTDKSVYSFNESDFSLTFIKNLFFLPQKEFFRFYNVNNELWVAGTVAGVNRFQDLNSSQGSTVLYKNYLISDVYRDSEGNTLLSTFNNGILVIPDLKIPDVLELENENNVVSICNDVDYGLVMGTLNGKLIGYNGKTFNRLSDVGLKPVQAVFSFPNCPFIIFDDGSVKVLNKQTGQIKTIHFGSLKDATMADSNTICLALNVGVIQICYTNRDELFVTEIPKLKIRTNAIASDTLNNLIFASTANGLMMLNKDGILKPLKTNNEAVFSNDIVFANGKLYAVTKDNDILVFINGKYAEKIQIGLNGGKSEILKLKVIDGKFYLNTSNGFFVTDKKGKVISQLNKAHGFSTNRIFDFDISGNYVWLAHSKGVQKISIDFLKPKIQHPVIRFSSIVINDSIHVNSEQLGDFNSDTRKFVFTLSSPTLRHKENIVYKYKLEGYDDKWLSSTYFDNKIVYNALQPGQYTFRAKSINNGVSGNEIKYTFSIEHPFYVKIWFIACLILLFVFITYLIYKSQLLKQRKKALLLNEINLSRLAAIQSQMNPHFIFNSLNAIQDLVLKGDVENSYTFITRFSDLIRRTLNYSDKDFIDFEEEIKLIELYLSLEKLRFKSSLHFTVNTNKIDDIMIPPMLIQPFIENALLHGLLHKEGKRVLKIEFALNDQLICTIEDNGVGREKAREIKLRQGSTHESFSSEAIKKRFEILSQQFNGNIGFHYEDLPTGTKVILNIPVKHKF